MPPPPGGASGPVTIGRYLLLSATHLRTTTAHRLNEWASRPPSDQPLSVAITPLGWWMSTCLEPGCRPGLLPDELPALLAAGLAADCDYILFEVDGPQLAALPVFPW